MLWSVLKKVNVQQKCTAKGSKLWVTALLILYMLHTCVFFSFAPIPDPFHCLCTMLHNEIRSASVRVNKSCVKGSKAEQGNGHNEEQRAEIKQGWVDTEKAVADKAAGVPLGRPKDKKSENNLQCQVHRSRNNVVFISVLYFHNC